MGTHISKLFLAKRRKSTQESDANRSTLSDLRDEASGPAPAPPVPPRRKTPKQQQQQFVVALFDFKAYLNGQLSLEKGWVLELVYKRNDDWWLVKFNDRAGHVPSSYVRLVDDESVRSTEGYMDVCRREAVRLLLLPYVAPGHYIVRPSSVANSLALSVRVQAGELPDVKHFKVQLLADGAMRVDCDNSVAFKCLKWLLQHYKRDELAGCRLVGPCPRTRPPNVPLQAVEVLPSSLVKVKEVGRGNFGAVYHGKLYEFIDVAIKEALPSNTMSRAQLLAEAESMHKVVHDKIVQLIGVCTHGPTLLIVTEYLPNGNLCQYLRGVGSTPFASNKAQWNSPSKRFHSQVAILTQVASGMQYLESLNIIHRDLRAVNVLVGDYDEVKVADFGLAKLLDTEEAYVGSDKSKFPFRWAAPEVFKHYLFTVKSDVWSFGMLAYETITMGSAPYGNYANLFQVAGAVGRGETPQFPHDRVRTFCPPSFYHKVMVPCWKQAQERPSFADLRTRIDQYETPAEELHYIDVDETLDPLRPFRKHKMIQKYD